MAPGIVGILLAAGSGSRFGADKRWQPLADGTPLALAAAARLLAACGEVRAVVRPGDAALAARLEALGCGVVFCAEAASGMGHSLAAGVQAAAGAAGWLVALADMPAIAPASYRAVLDALACDAAFAVPVHDGRRGHPVGFAGRKYVDLRRLSGDKGARELLRAQAAQVVEIPVDDPGILADVDTPADLASLSQALTVDRENRPKSVSTVSIAT